VLFRVRLLGVAEGDRGTAERATQALAAIAPAGPAFLELDKRRSADDGSWLAYVYLGGRLLSDAVIRGGWGRYEAYSGDAMDVARLLSQAEKQARSEQRGIWGIDPPGLPSGQPQPLRP
jgi:endonuclease YncB( thermonuclease family)